MNKAIGGYFCLSTKEIQCSIERKQAKLVIFQLLLCGFLFVTGVETLGIFLAMLMEGDQPFNVLPISMKLLIQLVVLFAFILHYRETKFYPDVRQFFVKGFYWKYLIALLCSLSVYWFLETYEFIISLPGWVYGIIAGVCICLFLFLTFYGFVPRQYVFEWKMKWGEIEFRKVVGEVDSPEEEKEIQKGEQQIEAIRQDPSADPFTYKKELKVNGELTFVYFLTWKNDEIEGIYCTPDTLDSIDEARCKAVRYLEEDGIELAVRDLQYVQKVKKSLPEKV